MIILEEYKEYLINTYKYELDNSEDKRNERKKILNKKYNDEYLNKIIEDTYKIINTIIIKNSNYCSIKINEYNTTTISLNLIGGWFSDFIYEDINGNLISEYILRKVFGNKLIIEEKIIEHEFDTEDPDILSFDYEHFLYLQGLTNNINENLKFLPKQKIKKKA